jgi:TfoX/Sxy family transcriptional regulator of competence genes
MEKTKLMEIKVTLETPIDRASADTLMIAYYKFKKALEGTQLSLKHISEASKEQSAGRNQITSPKI